MNFIILLLAAGAMVYFNQGKAFLKEFRIQFLKAKFNQSRTASSLYTKIAFTLRFKIVNPTNFEAVLKSGKLSVYFQGKKIGDLLADKSVKIAKNGESDVEVPAELSTLKFFSSVQDLIHNVGKGSIPLYLVGYLKFDAGTITIKQPYNVDLF